MSKPTEAPAPPPVDPVPALSARLLTACQVNQALSKMVQTRGISEATAASQSEAEAAALAYVEAIGAR